MPFRSSAKANPSFPVIHIAGHGSGPAEPLRVCLFTDTLGDINGVSRFIRNVAEQARSAGHDLHVITSTRFACPEAPNVHNLPPRLARPMPGYPTLDVVWPDRAAMVRACGRVAPHVVHISTPGPVGLIGRRWARRRGVPLVGTYHTDFPAYIDHLFHDDAMTWACRRTMRWFYAPFARLLTRSAEYAAAITRLGIDERRIVRLLPGIDTAAFDASHRDRSGAVWDAVPGARRASAKALYVGRISVEKNLPMLARIWPRTHRDCARRGVDAQLIVVGDGPYRAQMQRELPGGSAVFAGFRHGRELSTIYASSDAFVFPSTTDTLGQAVMEAQCAGLPVLVTDQGGPAGVVDHRQTGFVLSAGASHESEWAGTLAGLLCEGELRARMGLAAAAKIAPMSIRHSFDSFWRVHESARQTSRAPHAGK